MCPCCHLLVSRCGSHVACGGWMPHATHLMCLYCVLPSTTSGCNGVMMWQSVWLHVAAQWVCIHFNATSCGYAASYSGCIVYVQWLGVVVSWLKMAVKCLHVGVRWLSCHVNFAIFVQSVAKDMCDDAGSFVSLFCTRHEVSTSQLLVSKTVEVSMYPSLQ